MFLDPRTVSDCQFSDSWSLYWKMTSSFSQGRETGLLKNLPRTKKGAIDTYTHKFNFVVSSSVTLKSNVQEPHLKEYAAPAFREQAFLISCSDLSLHLVLLDDSPLDFRLSSLLVVK